MYFNRQRIYKIDELIKLTNTDQEIMQSELENLKSFKLLIYNEEGNSLKLNQKFQHRSQKIKVQSKKQQAFSLSQKSKTKLQEFKIDQKEIVLDRRVYLESLIVRVLIRKKQMDHKDLFIIKYNFKNQQLLAFIIDIQYLYYQDRIIFIYRNLLFNLSMKSPIQQIAKIQQILD
ncbi:unnamed protein product [Paramecium primaurelia]|uniref:Uncharacterized protein n=1 Tax=Paramecium primaurelia TaxID=5886 RepID=A0A8S1KF04_PARPR|nr:unnamed protein product [Paramecium primaurelia]